MEKKDKCPYCGSENSVIGVQNPSANIHANKKIITGLGQTVYHVVCLQCGTVIRSFVKEPEKLAIK